MNNKLRVVVGMSGGVDSSTAAALLDAQGFEVIGVMLRLWNDDRSGVKNRCCSPESMVKARQVCHKLSIPFYVINASDVFYNKVVDFFIKRYQNAVTPNPCLECNRYVRWGFLFDYAENLGADYFVTGHYARIKMDKKGVYFLMRGIDYAKDQSYVLSILDQKKLSKTLLPLGNFTKLEVRKLAEEFDLPVADRKESQDLCFLGNRDYREFLQHYSPHSHNPGDIIDVAGNKLGIHRGLAYYTVGQRRSLGITSAKPLYVIEKNAETNQLIVGNTDMRTRSELCAWRANWISGVIPKIPFHAQIKIRYHADLESGIIIPFAGDRFKIKFDKPVKDITPGQAAVIYAEDVCLGGGIIEG